MTMDHDLFGGDGGGGDGGKPAKRPARDAAPRPDRGDAKSDVRAFRPGPARARPSDDAPLELTPSRRAPANDGEARTRAAGKPKPAAQRTRQKPRAAAPLAADAGDRPNRAPKRQQKPSRPLTADRPSAEAPRPRAVAAGGGGSAGRDVSHGGPDGGPRGGFGGGGGDRPSGGRISAALNVTGLLFASAFLLVIAAGAVAGLYLNRLGQDLPDYAQLADYEPPVTTRVYAGDGALVAEFARERRLFVPAEAIPDLVKQAFISAEDKSFYDHGGIDFKGVVRSQISNVTNILQGRRLEGGSTITQQVAKNFLLSSEQKLDRKMKEWLISRRIERAFTKDEILELYLNEIYLGNRSYGVAAAALNYFDRPLNQLTIEEAAYLAAIPKGPSNYHPQRNYERAFARRNWVIGRMIADGKIDPAAGAEAQERPLEAVIAPPLGARDWTTEYFAEEVRKEIADLYGAEALYDGGLAVRTTVDPRLQEAAGKALRRWLVDYDQRHGWRGPLGALEIDGDWSAAFEALAADLTDVRKIADDLSPWRPAVVLETTREAARIGLAGGARGVIPLSELSWARAYGDADKLGAEVSRPSDVLKAGDVILVEPLDIDAAASDVGPAAASGDDEADGADEARPVAPSGRYALRQAPAVNGALVAIDPHTGRVLAMVGGFSFQLSEFNRAVQAQRQPGSTFKPFVYAAALDSGYTPSSIVLDAPFVAPSVGSWWKPGNYIEGRFYGESTLRLGIEQSRNSMTARLAQELGIGRIIDYAQRFNLSDQLPRELAISLGSGETTLTRITAAYSTFVNGGKGVQPFLIDRVQDRRGRTIYKRDARECPDCAQAEWTEQPEPQLADPRQQIIDPRTAYQMVSMLEGVVERGTGRRVGKVVDKPIAGKTGTTNDYKDAWFVGFSPDLAAGVYVGFDLPQTLGSGEAGGKVAAPIFGDFMAEALKETPGIPFRVPSGVRLVRVNAKSGEPANAGDANVILEAFKTDDVLGARPAITGDLIDIEAEGAAATPPARRESENSELDELNGLY